jgi:hypothetical protein
MVLGVSDDDSFVDNLKTITHNTKQVTLKYILHTDKDTKP